MQNNFLSEFWTPFSLYIQYCSWEVRYICNLFLFLKCFFFLLESSRMLPCTWGTRVLPNVSQEDHFLVPFSTLCLSSALENFLLLFVIVLFPLFSFISFWNSYQFRNLKVYPPWLLVYLLCFTSLHPFILHSGRVSCF